MPYFRAKAQDYFESLGGGIDPSLFEDDPGLRSSLRRDGDVS